MSTAGSEKFNQDFNHENRHNRTGYIEKAVFVPCRFHYFKHDFNHEFLRSGTWFADFNHDFNHDFLHSGTPLLAK